MLYISSVQKANFIIFSILDKMFIEIASGVARGLIYVTVSSVMLITNSSFANLLFHRKHDKEKITQKHLI